MIPILIRVGDVAYPDPTPPASNEYGAVLGSSMGVEAQLNSVLGIEVY